MPATDAADLLGAAAQSPLCRSQGAVRRVRSIRSIFVMVKPCLTLPITPRSSGSEKFSRFVEVRDENQAAVHRRDPFHVPAAQARQRFLRRADGGCRATGETRGPRRRSSPTLRPPELHDDQPRAHVVGARSNPNRARRFTAGTTCPRENTTPSTNGAAFGTRVTCLDHLHVLHFVAAHRIRGARHAQHDECLRRSGCLIRYQSSSAHTAPRGRVAERARRPLLRQARQRRRDPESARRGRRRDRSRPKSPSTRTSGSAMVRTTISRCPTMRSTASPRLAEPVPTTNT